MGMLLRRHIHKAQPKPVVPEKKPEAQAKEPVQHSNRRRNIRK